MNGSRQAALAALQQGIGHSFADPELLENALTHRSYVNENPSNPRLDNERLEFLGDAVLELVVSHILVKRFPNYTEGQLSKLRSAMVNEQPLAEFARRFGIGELLLLGRGEEATGGRSKPSLLADAFESLLAALYLDAGFERTFAFVESLVTPLIEKGAEAALFRDYKTAAQELCQVRYHELPRYVTAAEEGPDHDKRFTMNLLVGDRVMASGTGRSKKEAEQQAAKALLDILGATPQEP